MANRQELLLLKKELHTILTQPPPKRLVAPSEPKPHVPSSTPPPAPLKEIEPQPQRASTAPIPDSPCTSTAPIADSPFLKGTLGSGKENRVSIGNALSLCDAFVSETQKAGALLAQAQLPLGSPKRREALDELDGQLKRLLAKSEAQRSLFAAIAKKQGREARLSSEDASDLYVNPAALGQELPPTPPPPPPPPPPPAEMPVTPTSATTPVSLPTEPMLQGLGSDSPSAMPPPSESAERSTPLAHEQMAQELGMSQTQVTKVLRSDATTPVPAAAAVVGPGPTGTPSKAEVPPQLPAPSRVDAMAELLAEAVRNPSKQQAIARVQAWQRARMALGLETGPLAARRRRGRAAWELMQSEDVYCKQLEQLVSVFLVPLQQHGVSAAELKTIFNNLQVLLNLSRLMRSELKRLSTTPMAPSAVCASTLLTLLPTYKVYQQYVAGCHPAQEALAALRARAEDEGALLLSQAEQESGLRLGELLVAPVRRLPTYALFIEQMLEETPIEAAERSELCQALSAVHDLCEQMEEALGEQQSRLRVLELQQQYGEALKPHLPDGLVLPHRRFLAEGELNELPLQPSDEPKLLHAFLFNDLLLCIGAESGAVHECISLAKVQIKLLHELDDSGSGEGDGTYAFELWNISKVWRFAAPSEEDRAAWVEQIQQQVRFLLASFKQRGKSLAFLPQNVQLLRQQLAKLQKQKESIEQQVLELTTDMCAIDAALLGERKRLAELQLGMVVPELLLTSPGAKNKAAAKVAQAEVLRIQVRDKEDQKAARQAEAIQCVEELTLINAALDATDEQHNDDSMLQYMLFSSA